MVSLLVVLQADVVTERLSALFARERFLPGVDAHVGTEIFRSVKGTLAHVAFKGLFSRVDEFVPP